MVAYSNLLNFVTPSTIFAISSPNFSIMSFLVIFVSSTTSWRSAAQIVLSSNPSVANIYATWTGWIMYGSPDFLSCPSCWDLAKSYALLISFVSIFLLCFFISFITSSNVYSFTSDIKSLPYAIAFTFIYLFI